MNVFAISFLKVLPLEPRALLLYIKDFSTLFLIYKHIQKPIGQRHGYKHQESRTTHRSPPIIKEEKLRELWTSPEFSSTNITEQPPHTCPALHIVRLDKIPALQHFIILKSHPFSYHNAILTQPPSWLNVKSSSLGTVYTAHHWFEGPFQRKVIRGTPCRQ